MRAGYDLDIVNPTGTRNYCFALDKLALVITVSIPESIAVRQNIAKSDRRITGNTIDDKCNTFDSSVSAAAECRTLAVLRFYVRISQIFSPESQSA